MKQIVFILLIAALLATAFIIADYNTAKALDGAMPPAIKYDGLKEQTMVRPRCYEEIPLSPELQSVLFDACDEYGIDYALALGLVQAESNFDPHAVSSSGCYGLCQLNPAYFPSGLAPVDNINHGIKYLARQIDVYGSVAAGLTAYNAGHDTGDRRYASVVLGYAAEWEDKLKCAQFEQ